MEWTMTGEHYVSKFEDITLKIRKNNLNKETHTFAYNTVLLYKMHEAEIIEYALKSIADFYHKPEIDRTLVDKLKNPIIEIHSNKDSIILWISFNVNEKTISCKFTEDLELLKTEIS
jgi:hypothetical protein